MIDWGDGDYEHTAAALAPVAERVLDVIDGDGVLIHGQRVLDVGCGTGNAAIAAARRGARVIAVDPAERLLAVAVERANAEGLTITALAGCASSLPISDESFDAAVSVFAVIFEQDASAAATELVRAVRPGGRIIVTAWTNVGGLAEVGAIVRDALQSLQPDAPPRSAPNWANPDYVRALFEPHGAIVDVQEASLMFEATSPESWFSEQEEHHPVWRFARRQLACRPGAWEALRAQSIERLAAWNLEPAAFRLASGYLIFSITKREAI